MTKKYKNTMEQYIANHRVNEDGEIERRCTICEDWKPENTENFYMMNKSKPEKGYMSQCKECIRKKAIKYFNETEEAQQRSLDWKKTHRERSLGHMKKHYQDN